jgi:signal transduction histidine kinase
MRLSDDGIPHMLDGKEIGASMALASMRYKMRVLGGTVEIERTPQGGTLLTAEMPIPVQGGE